VAATSPKKPKVSRISIVTNHAEKLALRGAIEAEIVGAAAAAGVDARTMGAVDAVAEVVAVEDMAVTAVVEDTRARE
jgi:hypothetical protein